MEPMMIWFILNGLYWDLVNWTDLVHLFTFIQVKHFFQIQITLFTSILFCLSKVNLELEAFQTGSKAKVFKIYVSLLQHWQPATEGKGW